jgi:hypothetical protein
MDGAIDESPAFKRFFPIVPRGLAGSLLAQDKEDVGAGDEGVDAKAVEALCGRFVCGWLRALRETCGLAERPDPIRLTERLLPDESSLEGDENAAELVAAAPHMIVGFGFVSADRTWDLFYAFVLAVREAMAGVTEEIGITETIVIELSNGSFSVKRRQ